MDNRLKLLPFGLLFAFGVKGLISGLSWETSSVILVLSVLFYALEHKIQDKKLENLQKKIDEELGLKIKALEQSHKDRDQVIADLKTSMSSMRAAAGFKQQSFKG